MTETIHTELPCRRDNYTPGRSRPAAYLVIHYVGASGGARDNALYYSRTGGIGASAHYFVGHADEGAAVYASVPEACRRLIRTSAPQEPVPGNHEKYEPFYRTYLSLYPALKEGFQTLAQA